ncbi:MAG TPA: hypothetical protein VMU83_13330 [Hanamia sp.]|nr:hypothetical protein [Hanamia sp.]
MEEKQLSEKESIELITSMINKAKNKVTESGALYLFWGWLILLCCIVQFTGLHFFNYTNSYYVWYSTWVLLIFQFFYIIKQKKSSSVKSYTGEINGFVWLVFFISMVLVIFISIHFKYYEIIYPLILVMYGMPTFLSGIILKFKPLIIGGASCWVFAILSSFVTSEYQSLFIAAAVIAAWIIPGYLLKKNYKKADNGI